MDNDRDYLDRLISGEKPKDSDFVPDKDGDVCLKHSANNVLKEGIEVRDSKPKK